MVKVLIDGIEIETERHNVTINDDDTIDIDKSVFKNLHDITYCVSPECKNECGRKMTLEEKEFIHLMDSIKGPCQYISYGYFCGEPEREAVKEIVNEPKE